MKESLIAFLRETNAFCARLNTGVAAFAVVLAIIAAAAFTVRAHRILPALVNALTAADPAQPEASL